MAHFDGASFPNHNSRHPPRRTAAAWLWTAALAAAQGPAPQPEEDIRPPRGLIEIPQPEPASHTAWMVTAVVVAVIPTGWLLWRMWCRRRQATRPEAKALAELSQLSKVRESIPAGEFADRAAATLRHYLTDRFGIAAPLTHDQEWIVKRLQDVRIGQVEDGTAIGSAVASAVDHLRDSDAKSRIAILLTDGVNNRGSVNPLTAAEAAKALGIKIYTIEAGTNGEAPYPVSGIFGGTQMQMMKVEIDEKILGEIADATGGQYYRATDTESLEHIYDEINRLETTPRKLTKYENYQELFLWFLLPGALLLLLEWLLSQTRFRRLP